MWVRDDLMQFAYFILHLVNSDFDRGELLLFAVVHQEALLDVRKRVVRCEANGRKR